MRALLAMLALHVLPLCAVAQTDADALALFSQVRNGDRAALSRLQAAADQGNAPGQFQLGRAYSHGSSILSRDDAAAARWVEKAALQGHLEAQSNLGYLYSEGLGVERSGEKAIAWYTRAAEGGFVQAQFNLALSYMQGRLVTRDEAKAFLWMRRAAEQGTTPAMVALAAMYANGQGVTKDAGEALRWLRKPLAEGHSRAIAMHDDLCARNARLCEGEPKPGHFVFDMPEPKLRIIIPDAPAMKMGPHPLAGVQSHAKYMGEGSRGYSISVLVPTADAGMTPVDCARASSAQLVRNYGLKRDDVVTRRTSPDTFVMLFPVRIDPLLQLKAYLLSGYRGTHCIEVHLSKVATSEQELAAWLKGFTQARIEALP